MPSRPVHDNTGLLVVGTGPRCGKTVTCAGLAGALQALGFKVQAVKPFVFQPSVSIRSGHEQLFFNKVAPPLQAVDTFSAESPHAMSAMDWQRLVETCRGLVYPYILEAPGPGVASPIRYAQGEVLDAVDLAEALDIPIVLVAPKQVDPVGRLAPVMAYLWHRDARVIGWIADEATPEQVADWDAEVLYLSNHYRVPYLGELAYSPSISVEALQQGNVIRTAELGIDLLPVQQALQVTVP